MNLQTGSGTVALGLGCMAARCAASTVAAAPSCCNELSTPCLLLT